MPKIAWVLFILIAVSGDLLARAETGDIVVGESVGFHSDLLDQDIKLSVRLPKGYSKSSARYPVLYSVHVDFLHTAGSVAQLSGLAMPETILVHLETYSSGDFLPTPIEGRPGSGGADRFIAFFVKELIPFVDSKYRTQPFRVFHSSSWGGLFGVYVMLTRPDAFNAVVAATPWLIYDGDSRFLLSNVKGFLERARFRRNFLFLALGNDEDPGLREGVAALARELEESGGGLTFEYRLWLEEDHYSTPHRALFDGLRWVYRDWTEIPEAVLARGVEAIKAHRKVLAGRFGFDIGLSRLALNRHGFNLSRQDRLDEAIGVFELNIEMYPDGPYSYEALGRALEKAGRLRRARVSFKQALRLAVEQSVADPQRYRDHVERIEGKLAEAEAEEE